MKNGPSTRFSLCPWWWAEEERLQSSLSAWLVLLLLSVFVEEVRAMMTKITVRSSEVDIYSNKQHVLAVFTTEANTSFHFSKQLGILSRNYLALSAPHPWLSTLPTIFMHSMDYFHMVV
jgi:hypothetical protein